MIFVDKIEWHWEKLYPYLGEKIWKKTLWTNFWSRWSARRRALDTTRHSHRRRLRRLGIVNNGRLTQTGQSKFSYVAIWCGRNDIAFLHISKLKDSSFPALSEILAKTLQLLRSNILSSRYHSKFVHGATGRWKQYRIISTISGDHNLPVDWYSWCRYIRCKPIDW